MLITKRMTACFWLPFQKLADDRLVQNLGWFALAELATRVSRFVATVVLARTLGAAEFGIAAIAMTSFELIRVLTNNGIGQMVARSSDEQLDATCNAAYRAGVIACGGAFVIQVGVGVAVALICNRADLFMMITSLACVYILMVPGLVPVYLIMRSGQTRALSGLITVQVFTDNSLTMLLALAGFGAWSIVLPKLLTAPIWLYGVRHLQNWDRNNAASHISIYEVQRFVMPIIGSEILNAMRLNLDKLIVWGLLGMEAVGVYYFAFNAGVGFSLSLTSALSNALYPELARHVSDPRAMLDRFDSAVLKTALPIAVVICIQAALCCLYVPLLFGSQWESAVLLVALLCFSASTKPFFDAGAQLLRASGSTTVEFAGALCVTIATLGALALGLTHSLFHGVAAFAITSMLSQGVFAIWARWVVRHQFAPRLQQGRLAPSSPHISGV
jgi:O-antigen/teichoic acid export membrane protein